jgi:hypothetical protein
MTVDSVKEAETLLKAMPLGGGEPPDLRANARWPAQPARDADASSRCVPKARGRVKPERSVMGVPIRAAFSPRYRPTVSTPAGSYDHARYRAQHRHVEVAAIKVTALGCA